jgi:adenylate cyclase
MDRRLTTILAADLVGYSRLMAADEEGVIARLQDTRAAVIDPALAEAGGRIVKTMGDGLLVEFTSPVAAVRAALTVQRAMSARETGPDEGRLRFRVGVNLGDIVIDGDDILGHGVNVAARL